MSRKIVKVRAKCFESYGLNKFRNFLAAPECECGCGHKGHLILEDEEALFGFMYDMLSDIECSRAAIFAHAYDDKMYAAIKVMDDDYDFDEEYDPDENPIKFFGINDTDMDFFREWDGEIRLCCYGLMIQRHDGNWDIIED